MYYYLKGNIAEIEPTHLVLDNQGIGYELRISLETYGRLKDSKEALLWTHFHVKEDSQQLFGFYTKSEKQLFQLLIGISGVGPSSALMVLSSLSVAEVVDAITEENVDRIKSVKGVGIKTAQRLIIELKDKVGKLGLTGLSSESTSNTLNNNVKEQALLALQALGIVKTAAQKTVERILKTNPGLSVEELIKQALKQK